MHIAADLKAPQYSGITWIRPPKHVGVAGVGLRYHLTLQGPDELVLLQGVGNEASPFFFLIAKGFAWCKNS